MLQYDLTVLITTVITFAIHKKKKKNVNDITEWAAVLGNEFSHFRFGKTFVPFMWECLTSESGLN